MKVLDDSFLKPEHTRIGTDGVELDCGATVSFSLYCFDGKKRQEYADALMDCCRRLNQIESPEAV